MPVPFRALVLSGETDLEMLKAASIRPDYVFSDVSELYSALVHADT